MSRPTAGARALRARSLGLLLALTCAASLAAPSAASAGCALLIFCSPTTTPTTPTTTTPAPTPVSSVSYGFSDVSWSNGYIAHSDALAEMSKFKVKYWRTNLSMQSWEGSENNTNQAYFSDVVNEYNQMLASGITPVFLVQGTPYWALTDSGKGTSKGAMLCGNNNNATLCNAPPDVRRQEISDHWQHFLQVMSYAMPKAVYEIWNEPNIDWGWMQPQDPELYGLLLKTAYEAIKQVSPSATVVSGSVNNYAGPDTDAQTSYQSFLSRMYAVAGKNSFDVLGWHAYPCPQVATVAGWTAQPATMLAGVRSARDAAGDTHKPLWLTEVGATTGANNPGNCNSYFSEKDQGPALAAVASWARAENDAHHDFPVVLINALFNRWARTNLWGTSNGQAEGEYGVIAWLKNPMNGSISLKYKPSYKPVACALAGTSC